MGSTQSTWGLHRARPTMNGLLVLSTLAAASAQVVLPYGGYAGLAGYPYGGLGYPYAVAKPVVNEVEVPVPVVQYAAIDISTFSSSLSFPPPRHAISSPSSNSSQAISSSLSSSSTFKPSLPPPPPS